MSDVERRSLDYFMSQASQPQWQGFLSALAAELNQQMPPAELRAFFYLVGQRMGEAEPLSAAQSLGDLEREANTYFGQVGWGWMYVRDMQTSLEFLHSCAPLRRAFGETSLHWASGLLEGLYSAWLRQLGAGAPLVLQQIGMPEGGADTLRFRLAMQGQM
jgi:hypothetical protein